MFCIIKSNYIISCNSFWINREKLGDYLKWTDYNVSEYDWPDGFLFPRTEILPPWNIESELSTRRNWRYDPHIH